MANFLISLPSLAGYCDLMLKTWSESTFAAVIQFAADAFDFGHDP